LYNIRLPAVISSILNIMDTVRTVKVCVFNLSVSFMGCMHPYIPSSSWCIRSRFKKVPGIPSYNLQELLQEGYFCKNENKEMYIDIFRRLRDAVRRNVPRNGETTDSHLRQCSSTPVGFGEVILS
jgi:hypothetical protein